MSVSGTILYRRSNFVTHLPVGHLYSPSHVWLGEVPGQPGRWQVGLTKFALRMLGELVDIQWECQTGSSVQAGHIVGHIEGFKAISDLYCVVDGSFLGGNGTLGTDLEQLSRDPYTTWLYEVEGTPDSRCMPVGEYQRLLDTTIDRILEKQMIDEAP